MNTVLAYLGAAKSYAFAAIVKYNPINIHSDSYQIAIDSFCWYSIAKHMKEYTGDIIPCNIKIQGFTGGCTSKWSGTWSINIG